MPRDYALAKKGCQEREIRRDRVAAGSERTRKIVCDYGVSPIGVEPIAQRLGRDASAGLPGISYSRSAFSRSCACRRRWPARQMQEIGDQAVAKQRDGLVV